MNETITAIFLDRIGRLRVSALAKVQCMWAKAQMSQQRQARISMNEAIQGHEENFVTLPDGRCTCTLNQHTFKSPQQVQLFIRWGFL